MPGSGSGWKRWALVAALGLSIGIPWPLLQTVAWVGMLFNYSREASFSQALSMTFDGKHPCPMCLAVQQGQAKEREDQQKQANPLEKLQLALPPTCITFSHPPTPPVPACDFNGPPSPDHKPPTPPPRMA